MFEELTSDENPAAGSSNAPSRSSLLMRNLQREAENDPHCASAAWASPSGHPESKGKRFREEKWKKVISKDPKSRSLIRPFEITMEKLLPSDPSKNEYD